MKLIIVESPTKAKTIGRFLGKGFEIKASMGHVMDLPKSKLGVDVKNDFLPQYEIPEDKKKALTELKSLVKKSELIILATDPDREGEAISAHIQQILSGGKVNGKIFQRIVFHEITKEAVENALKNPGVVNKNLVNAQTARRVLDRLVGYNLSPILWRKVRRGLSAGRVQSVALRLIVEREREIEKFKKEEYWTICAVLTNNNQELADKNQETSFELIEINEKRIEIQNIFNLYDGQYKVSKTIIENEKHAVDIINDLQGSTFTVSDIIKKEIKRSPQPPFTTSTLQQEAARRFGYSGKRTMSLAQKLYEEGFITYHRTDSVNLSRTAVFQMRNFLEKEFGEKYIPEKSRFFKGKQKLAQEAHEAIRPTNSATRPEAVTSQMDAAYGKLYELIWRRALASQMSDSLIESTTVLVDAKNKNKYRFKANGSVLVFDGFLKMNPFGLQDKRLPMFTIGENLELKKVTTEKHETPPPPRYNDASLIASLEEEGIGRPSTYASIIGTIEARNYIERSQGRFIPTSIGIAVNDFLVKNFSDIDDIPFTASMEDELDAIASGTKNWVPVIREFYTPFEKKLQIVKNAERVQISAEETGEICPKCSSPLVIRVGRFGKFISCKNFPTCDFKKAFIQETNFICPKDGGKIVARKTKKKRTFYGCSNYPRCNFAVWKLQDLKKEEKIKIKDSGKMTENLAHTA